MHCLRQNVSKGSAEEKNQKGQASVGRERGQPAFPTWSRLPWIGSSSLESLSIKNINSSVMKAQGKFPLRSNVRHVLHPGIDNEAQPS
jgi:hypothetical protein